MMNSRVLFSIAIVVVGGGVIAAVLLARRSILNTAREPAANNSTTAPVPIPDILRPPPPVPSVGGTGGTPVNPPFSPPPTPSGTTGSVSGVLQTTLLPEPDIPPLVTGARPPFIASRSSTPPVIPQTTRITPATSTGAGNVNTAPTLLSREQTPSVLDTSPQLAAFRAQMIQEGALTSDEFAEIKSNDEMEAFLLRLIDWQAAKSTTTPVEQINDAKQRIKDAYAALRAAQ